MSSNFVKPYSDRRFNYTTTVRHKGKLIAFAQNDTRRIFYAVLDLENTEVTSTLDVAFWPNDPLELRFPNEITEVGVGVADQTVLPDVKKGSRTPVHPAGTRVPGDEKDWFLSSTARLSAAGQFQALSDGRYVYLFRQAVAGNHRDVVYKTDDRGNPIKDADGKKVPIVDDTLLLDRFVLAGGTLQTKMEVRFQRSRSKTRPLNRKDSLGAKDMEERPFFEPTQELRFVGALSNGRFHVLSLPTQIPDIRRWQIFSYNAKTGGLDSYNVEASEDGLFNTRGSQASTREGHAESAVQFSEDDHHVSLSKGITLGDEFTQEAWLNVGEATTGDDARDLIKGQHDDHNAAPYIQIYQGRAIRGGFGDGQSKLLQFTTKGVLASGWNHIAVTYNGKYYCVHVNGRERARVLDAEVFVNGEKQPEPIAGAFETHRPAAKPIKFFGSKTSTFLGTVDEIRVWDRVRSEGEIQADMDRRLNGREPGLVGYWRFDEAGGSDVFDQTDNDNRGKLRGGSFVTSDAPVGVSSGLTRSSFRFRDRTIESGMSALQYFHQESQTTGYDGATKPIKRSARVMLAVATKAKNGTHAEIAALDFGVSSTGRLAQTPDNIALPNIEQPSDNGETIEDKLDRVTTLGQKVVDLGSDITNLKDDINELNHAKHNVEDALHRRVYRTTIIADDLEFLNDKIEALRKARDDAANAERRWRDLDGQMRRAEVTVYEHINYGGRRMSFRKGSVSYTQLNTKGFNDLISSLRVPAPLRVRVYQHAGFKGKHKDHTNNERWVGHSWNDIISSMSITEDPGFRKKINDARDLADNADSIVAALENELNIEQTKLDTALKGKNAERQLKELELTSAKAELERDRAFLNEGVAVPMQLVHSDPFGLSISGGILEFAWTKDTPLLFDSATGKLAMYFRGEDDQFFVSYYNTLTQRAQYKVVNDRSDTCVICTARSAEPEMDQITIGITETTGDDQRCDITLVHGDYQERWTSVPRDPLQLTRVLNGQATERAFVGHSKVIASSGSIVGLEIPDGLRRSLVAGDTLVVDRIRLTVVDDASRGATEVKVKPRGVSSPSGAQPAFYLEFDYEKNAVANKVPADLSIGSLLIRAETVEAAHPVQIDQALKSGQTINCLWTAAAPGYTLTFDGATGLAHKADKSEKALESFAAPRNVTMEAWVRPDEINEDDPNAIIVQHKSLESQYALGLQRQPLPSGLLLDGSSTYVLVPNVPELNLRNAFTIEAWIQPAATDGFRNIVAHGYRQAPDGEVYLRINEGVYEFGLWDGSDIVASFDMPTEDTAGVKNWVHLAGVYDGTSVTLFRNGEQVASAAADRGPVDIDAPWGIGARGHDAAERVFQGGIDEVRIWKRARTEETIQRDMQRRLGGNETDLVGYWHFDGGLARDYSRNGNDAAVKSEPVTIPSPIPAHKIYANADGKHVLSQGVFPSGSWTHLAAVYNQSYGIQFRGPDNYLDCGTDVTLDLNRDLTIEVFLKVDPNIPASGLLSRGQIDDGTDEQVPYALFIDNDGKLVFAFEDTDHKNHEVKSNAPIKLGKFTRIAVTRKHESKVTERKNPQGQVVGVDVSQWDDIRLYEGTKEIKHLRYEGVEAGSSNDALFIGRAHHTITFPPLFGIGDPFTIRRQMGFYGIMSEVRVWNSARAKADLGSAIKGDESGLVSWWRFEENEGNIAYDSKSSNHARVKGRVIWVKNPDTNASQFLIYRNGSPVETNATKAHGFTAPNRQFALACLDNNQRKHFFQGEMEEVRIWRTVRTHEQINDNLFRRVLGEKENLIAYYPFDAESTGSLTDHSFLGNDLDVSHATYVLSTAPIGEDTPEVRSALAGIKTPFNGLLHSKPGVSEYGDMQYDADGNLIGALKRCYSFVTDNEWRLSTGFKVGNLVTEWLGQVQFAPQLIGYIEGAPPVPSENLTGTGTVRGEFSDYNGASGVEIAAAESTTYTYASSRDTGFDMSIEAKIGFLTKFDAEAGLGFTTSVASAEGSVGAHLLFEHSLGWLNDASSGSGLSTTKLSKMELRGGVENVDDIAYPEIGRRFVPENFGFALVQSDTADVFALRLEHNNALISFQIRPNPDIPKDWNIITFPINPRYTKQGTLDGKTGFKPDPNYPNALAYSSDISYFKPIEAYALKNRIQREEERMRSYFDQYDAGAKGRRQADVHFSKGDLGTGDILQKLPKIEKRNLVNTYVWTADGGLFAETEETLDLQSETTGGSYSFKGMAGLYADVKFAVGGAGLAFELDALFGGHLNLNVTKTQESESTFGVNVDLSGVEGDIYHRDEDGNILIDTSDPLNPRKKKLPGKVDAYRFMTFYLEPDTNHFDHFFSTVVDPIWLAQSGEPNAVALRQARDDKKAACWRVMHRVTYVSRILPALDNAAPPPLERTMRAQNIDSNYELIQLLEPFVLNEITDFGAFSRATRNALKTYHPELLPHAPAIIQYLSLYYGVSEEPVAITAGADDGEGEDGAPLHPVVDAGQETHTTTRDTELILQGTLENSQQPIENLLITWTVVGGDVQNVSISPADTLETTVSFAERGVYTLRLTVNDGLLSISDDTTVKVNVEPNISAGNDADLLPLESATVMGQIIDHGLADEKDLDENVLWSEWEQISGPGETTFGDKSALITDATFTTSGRYLLRLTVSNGTFTVTDDVVISVAARVTAGLEALYVFEERTGTIVRDVSAAGSPLALQILDGADTTWIGNGGGLLLREPSTLQSTTAVTRMLESVRETNAMTVEAWVKPSASSQEGLARIITCSSGPDARNFVLGQQDDRYYVAMRTESTNRNGSDKALAAGTVVEDELAHVVCTRDATGSTVLYVNGEEVAQRVIGGNLANWDLGLTLAMGNEVATSTRDRAWSGELHLVAVYNRALSPSEIKQNLDFGANTNLSPIADAGPDQMLALPDTGTVTGTVLDDRLLPDKFIPKWTQAGGPAPVEFDNSSALETTVGFSNSGRYVLRLTVTEPSNNGTEGLSASDETIFIVNQKPDIEVDLPRRVVFPETTQLRCTMHDDGLGDPAESGNVTHTWTQKEGPSEAVITDPAALVTDVTLQEPGAYVFQITVDNGRLPPRIAETTIYANKKPQVRASATPIVTLPDQAALRGTDVDLGLYDPEGIVTRTWSGISGPAPVDFGDVNEAETTAVFLESGKYELEYRVEISGEDFALASTAVVTVIANDAPTVDAGPDFDIVLPASAELDAVVSDDGLPDPPGRVSCRWSKVSGPGQVIFADVAAAYTTARFTRSGTYVVQLAVKDYEQATPVVDTVTIEAHAPPRVAQDQQVLYRFREGSGTTVKDVSGVGEPIDLTADPGDQASLQWLSDGLKIDGPTILMASDATRLYDALKASNAITIEAWLVSAPHVSNRQNPTGIVTFSADTRRRNFSLGQTSHDRYEVRLRTTETNRNGTRRAHDREDITQDVPAVQELSHLVYTRDAAGKVKFYLNGRDPARWRDEIEGTFENWDAPGDASGYHFALANEIGGNRPWTGQYHLVAIYSRALSEAEIQQNIMAGI